MEEKYIVALEIGSSKVRGAVGTVDSAGALSVKSVEEERLYDEVRYGRIRNVVETANAIKNVLTRLEQREAQRKITGVFVSIGGRSMASHTVDVERRFASETEITKDIINDIVSDAYNRPLHERTIVCVSPCEFRVDKTPTTKAVGMIGETITARLNVISCRNQLMRNLTNVLEDRLQLKVHEIFVRQIAEANFVLLPEERRRGCMFVDFGAETTTVSIYKNGLLEYLNTLPLGSRNITRDLTIGLNYLEERAEELKIEGGNAIPADQPTSYSADYTSINNYVVARAGEIIANINEQMKYAKFNPDKLPAGIIIVGKGAKLNGFNQRLATMTGMNVRLGVPNTHIRINDGRIQSTDAVDVLATLYAAKDNPVECMNRPTPVFVQQEPAQHIFNTDPQATSYQPAQQPVQQPAQHSGQQPAQQPAQQTFQQPGQQTSTHYPSTSTPQPTTSNTKAGPQKLTPPEIGYDENDEQENSYPEPRKESWWSKRWKQISEKAVNLMSDEIEVDEE